MTCAIYCRLSREDGLHGGEGTGESESIQNQKALLTAYAAEHGWEVGEVYWDENYSGADDTRPAFCRMLRDAELGRFSILLCKTQSRFTRDLTLVERYLHHLFPLWGIRFVAVLDQVDTALPGGRKARQINGLVNQWYLEDLSENVRSVLTQKRRAGQFIGSRPPYGYQKDPENHNRLSPDPATAWVVVEIFSLALGGLGKKAIAAHLTGRGIPGPGGGDWSGTAVGRILRRECYTGTLVQGQRRRESYRSPHLLSLPKSAWIRVEDCHPPLITKETFQAVGRRMDGNTRSGGGGTLHPLAGKVFCGDCGAPLTRTTSRRGERHYTYLQCAGLKKGGEGACTRHSIRLDALTAALCQLLSPTLESLPWEALWAGTEPQPFPGGAALTQALLPLLLPQLVGRVTVGEKTPEGQPVAVTWAL